MAKYYGKIGFGQTSEIKPGVWKDTIVEKNYYGDILQNFVRNDNTQQVNDNLNISNRFSIVSDPFATQNYYSIKYLEYLGVKWKVTTVELQYPRLILYVGGAWNADKT
jgi:hypothetical protein